jgi:hypothetical protein
MGKREPVAPKAPNFSYRGFNQVSGDQGEFYCRQLYHLMVNPDGMNRPDLVSVNGEYDPKLSVEVKVGKDRKGIINLHGLVYGLKCAEDYQKLFGTEFIGLPRTDELFTTEASFPTNYPVACYYDILHRTDELKNENLTGEYDGLKVKFGDQFIVPFEYAFHSFLIGRMIRLHEKFEDSFRITKAGIDTFFNERAFAKKRTKNNWQNMYCDDILAWFRNDSTILRSDVAKVRYRHMIDNYAGLQDLVRVEMVGPGDTTIYALAKPEHLDLFEKQIKNKVGDRRKTLDRLVHARASTARDLDDLRSDGVDLLEAKEEGFSPKYIERLDNLLAWKTPKDNKGDLVFKEITPPAHEVEEALRSEQVEPW